MSSMFTWYWMMAPLSRRTCCSLIQALRILRIVLFARTVHKARAPQPASVNWTVTLISTSTGSPLSRVGSNSHWFTASIAA